MNARQAIRLIPLLAIAAVVALVAGAAVAQTEPESPFLGVSVADDPSGALVIDILPDGPAAEAGVEVDDIITAIDGETVVVDDVSTLLADYAVGDRIELDVLRGDETLTLTATLANRADFNLPDAEDDATSEDDATPEANVMPEAEATPGAEVTPEANITPEAEATPEADVTPVEPATPSERAFLGVSVQNVFTGIVVRDVASGSPADEAGLETNDIIKAVDGKTLANAEDLIATIQALEPGDTITLDYTRDDEALSAEITLAATSDPVPSGRGSDERGGQGRGEGRGGRRGGQGLPFGFEFNTGEILLYDAEAQSWRVVSLSEDSPLYEAGLRAGDAITAINGEMVEPSDLTATLEGLDDDADVTLSVERDGETQELTVAASDLEALASPLLGLRGMDDMGGMMPFHFNMPMMGGIGVRLGVTYVNLTAESAAENEVDVTEGALVSAVDDDSPAADAGLQTGDVITAVDGDIIDEERTLRDRLYAYEPEDTVTLTVLRDGEEVSLEVTLAAAENTFMGRFGEDMLPFLEGHPLPNMPEDIVPDDAPAL